MRYFSRILFTSAGLSMISFRMLRSPSARVGSLKWKRRFSSGSTSHVSHPRHSTGAAPVPAPLTVVRTLPHAPPTAAPTYKPIRPPPKITRVWFGTNRTAFFEIMYGSSNLMILGDILFPTLVSDPLRYVEVRNFCVGVLIFGEELILFSPKSGIFVVSVGSM